MSNIDQDAVDIEELQGYSVGIPLQTTEDHLGRVLGHEAPDSETSADLTWREERDQLFTEDDEELLEEREVENAEDDAIDADDDDAVHWNRQIPSEFEDGTRRRDLLTTENERRDREGHTIAPGDET